MKYQKHENNISNKKLYKIMDGKYLYVIFTYNSKERRLVYTDTCSTLELAKKKLNKYAMEKVPAVKAIRGLGSKYNAIYLLENAEGDVVPVRTLFRATEEINKIYQGQYKIKVKKANQEVDCGYIGFAYNSKTNSVVCTRLYDDTADVKNHITKRHGVEKSTVQVLDVIKVKSGFRFISSKYANCTRLKHVKNALMEDKRTSLKELLENELNTYNTKEAVEKILNNLSHEELINLLSEIKEER